MYNVVNFTIHIFNVKMEMRYNKQLPWGSSIKSTVNSYSTKEEKKIHSLLLDTVIGGVSWSPYTPYLSAFPLSLGASRDDIYDCDLSSDLRWWLWEAVVCQGRTRWPNAVKTVPGDPVLGFPSHGFPCTGGIFILLSSEVKQAGVGWAFSVQNWELFEVWSVFL